MNPRTIFTVLLAGAALCTTAVRPAIAQYSRPVPRDQNPNTVAEIGPEVARVRLQKLGYSNIQLTREGDYWQANATKDGKTWQVRLHARTGAVEEKPMPAEPK